MLMELIYAVKRLTTANNILFPVSLQEYTGLDSCPVKSLGCLICQSRSSRYLDDQQDSLSWLQALLNVKQVFVKVAKYICI